MPLVLPINVPCWRLSIIRYVNLHEIGSTACGFFAHKKAGAWLGTEAFDAWVANCNTSGLETDPTKPERKHRDGHRLLHEHRL